LYQSLVFIFFFHFQAWDRWKGGNISELISPTLTEAPHRQVERCIHVVLLYVQENPTDRPIMSDVIAFLTTASIILPEPKQPAYFNVRVTERGLESSEFDGSSCSINEYKNSALLCSEFHCLVYIGKNYIICRPSLKIIKIMNIYHAYTNLIF
jgi:hypothetical protein